MLSLQGLTHGKHSVSLGRIELIGKRRTSEEDGTIAE